jgi:S1-C subfamily serine protease
MRFHAGIVLLSLALTATPALAQDEQRELEKHQQALEKQREDLEEQHQDLEKQQQDLESQLEAARERLDEAAREVSELTTQLSVPVFNEAWSWERAPRAVIGVQLNGKNGARIEKVSPGGPAADAGIRAGDVIVALNGEKIEGEDAPRDVVRQMRKVEPNSKVKVRVLRDGKPRDFELTARAPAMPPVPPHPPLPPEAPALTSFLGSLRNELSGMELATLTPALGEYFGTDKGVLVLRAPESGTYKLKDGDVILTIDGREPKSGSHATRILRSYQPGEEINIRIMRQRKPISLQVTTPDPALSRAKARLLSRENGDPL